LCKEGENIGGNKNSSRYCADPFSWPSPWSRDISWSQSTARNCRTSLCRLFSLFFFFLQKFFFFTPAHKKPLTGHGESRIWVREISEHLQREHGAFFWHPRACHPLRLRFFLVLLTSVPIFKSRMGGYFYFVVCVGVCVCVCVLCVCVVLCCVCAVCVWVWNQK
jgi:hypothetical protein